jgi:hypothetical protein
MKTMHRFFCLSLFATSLGGCAADASAGASGDERAKERLRVASQADSSGYLQTFDPSFQSIIFQPSSAIDWVILHVTIDGTRTTNVGMPETGTSAAAGPSYEVGSLPVLPGDSVVYSFTYSVNGLAQDTPQFSSTLPDSWVPTTFFTEVTNGTIEVVSSASLAWADVHYTVNGGPQNNVRLSAQGSGPSFDYAQPVTLDPGDVLAYSVTYATSVAVFDTATVQFTAGSGATRFVVDLGADTTTGNCVSNGDSGGQCNLRAALLAAQSTVGPVTIDLSIDSTVSAGQIDVAASSAPSGHILVESAPGGAAHAIASAAGNYGRLFQVASGVTLGIDNVSITGFSALDTGAAIVNDGNLDLEGVTVAGNATLCSDTGAMTASATCTGGAISNAGTLTLGGGTAFTNNTVTADASTAAYTTAWAGGGAISSSGTVAIVGPVTFAGNAASAVASSGYHPEPIGGADASASGGAIFTSGTLTVTAPAGTCQFTKNSASATGSSVNGTTTLTSQGGAIENTGTLQIPAGACTFSGNSAATDADIDG